MALDQETENIVRVLITAWYGAQASSWSITDETVLQVAKVLENSGKCSDIMQYVPTPMGAFSGASTLTKMGMNYIKTAIKKAASDKALYYNSCIIVEAARFKNDIFLSQ